MSREWENGRSRNIYFTTYDCENYVFLTILIFINAKYCIIDDIFPYLRVESGAIVPLRDWENSKNRNICFAIYGCENCSLFMNF